MSAGADPGRARRALFLSDVHLSETQPRTSAAFLDFIKPLAAAQVDTLYILGDLFEYWAGDDDLLEPLNRTVVTRLRDLADRGLALFLITGNRDLLLGQGFARSAGLTILSDPSRIEVAGQDLVISHGDALCTDDRAYQDYRTMVRSPDWQKAFLAKPLAERKEVIGSLREASEAAKMTKSAAIMDVNASAVAELFRSTGARQLIHGHTHRPGVERCMVDGLERTRWVLPDWDGQARPPRGGGLLVDGDGLRWISLPAAAGLASAFDPPAQSSP